MNAPSGQALLVFAESSTSMLATRVGLTKCTVNRPRTMEVRALDSRREDDATSLRMKTTGSASRMDT